MYAHCKVGVLPQSSVLELNCIGLTLPRAAAMVPSRIRSFISTDGQQVQ